MMSLILGLENDFVEYVYLNAIICENNDNINKD